VEVLEADSEYQVLELDPSQHTLHDPVRREGPRPMSVKIREAVVS
jgi:hypothetical protein